MTSERSGSPTAGEPDTAEEADSPRPSGYGRRVSAFALDQAIAGGSNVLLVVAAARLLDVDDFARVSIVFMVYGLILVASRSLIGIPVLMYPVEAAEREADVIRSGWAVGLLATALSLIGALVTMFFDESLARALGILAVFSPGLIVQDVGRFLAFTTRRISRAITLDLVWLVGAIVSIATLQVIDRTSAMSFLAAWAGSGAVAALLVHFFWSATPRPGFSWLRVTRRASALTLIESIVLQAGALAMVGVAGLFAGRPFIAGFAGAQVLARPLSLILQTMSASGVSEVAHGTDRRGIVRAAWNTSWLATTGCAIVLGVLLAVPDRLGELVLGDNWHPTEVLLLPFTAYMLAEAMSTGPHAALRGLKRLNLLVTLSVMWIGLAIVVIGLGYELGGAQGIIWAISAARIVYVTVLIAFLARYLGRDDLIRPDPEPTDPGVISPSGPAS